MSDKAHFHQVNDKFGFSKTARASMPVLCLICKQMNFFFNSSEDMCAPRQTLHIRMMNCRKLIFIQWVHQLKTGEDLFLCCTKREGMQNFHLSKLDTDKTLRKQMKK